MSVDPGLQITPENLIALEAMAGEVNKSVADHVNDSAILGLALAGFAIEAAPEPVYVGFQRPDSEYDLYPVTFDDAPKPDVPDELAALEASFHVDQLEYPLNTELLAQVTDIAMLLCVARTDFIKKSLIWGFLEAKTTGRDGDIVVRMNGVYYQIELTEDEVED